MQDRFKFRAWNTATQKMKEVTQLTLVTNILEKLYIRDRVMLLSRVYKDIIRQIQEEQE